MAAEQAPEPALRATRQPEIPWVDAQDSAALDHHGVEPLWQDEEQTVVGLLPTLDPAESGRPASGDSYTRLHLGARETVEPCLEQGILGLPCLAAEKAQNLKGGCRERRGDGNTTIGGLGELRHGPNQDIRVPDSREPRAASGGAHAEKFAPVFVNHRRVAGTLGEREAGPGHQIDGVARTYALEERRERTRHSLPARQLRHSDLGSPRVRRGDPQPLVRPALKVLDAVDHPSADLAVGRAGAEGPVLLERTAGEAEEARGFGGAQVAGRDTGVHVGHDRASGKGSGRIDAEWRLAQGRIPGVAEIDQEESENGPMALVSRPGAAASEAGDICRLTWPRPSSGAAEPGCGNCCPPSPAAPRRRALARYPGRYCRPDRDRAPRSGRPIPRSWQRVSVV